MYTNSSVVNNTTSASLIEWESTITVQISEDEYNRAFDSKNYKIDVIFLFKDGIRVANRVVEKKTRLTSRKLLSFYKNNWIPIERTTSLEERVLLPEIFNVEKCIYRVIVYHENNIRKSYNKEINQFGEKYNIEYEIEYPANIEYAEIVKAEKKLVKLFLQDKITIARDIMSRIDMFSCVMSKVQMWHCFDDKKPYIWAYKWNGIKSKLLITNKLHTDGVSYITYIWSDASKIINTVCNGPNIEHLINICCAVEIMEDRIVIIEAIGSLVNEEIYTTEPTTNALFLKHINKILTEPVTIDDKPVEIQKFFKQPMPNTYGDDYDGFIIIQDDLIIKWKIPTIDVKCITPNTFKVGSQLYPLDFVGEPGKIYEVTYKKEVLRQRNDRIAASSDQEYAVFLESSKALLGESQ